jgi:hypothetical protein
LWKVEVEGIARRPIGEVLHRILHQAKCRQHDGLVAQLAESRHQLSREGIAHHLAGVCECGHRKLDGILAKGSEVIDIRFLELVFVTATQLASELVNCALVADRTADLFLENLIGYGRLEFLHLTVEGLTIRRYTGVA